ncbi:MAG TPA: Asp-tRNA(Asn)/Glu-tRNA(Gln) amidotransferase subunit GatB [Nitrospiria bacterium]|nr:Asp-tRNA(Asn)/Glu-tRNA(Gln) amidotransferase subunit GatB [Nitrospiria bacterium]HUK56829.1 Asp-tRNA(Asn)/Glu-tRNA(Gln) amidotransferase subunit GatB [Nitrospiria bacterium]
MQYEVVVGLEVHAQLKTASKIFCGCSTKFGAGPNTQTCPVCLGMPGVLPVLNRRVLELAVKTGLALHCRIAPYSRFARKNYFYPDLPKGYQISQYELPLCEHGYLEVALPAGQAGVNGRIKRIGIRRAHMEEDAGKNLHEGLEAASHVDLNRAGVPLLEIVSEPDIRSVDEAVAYLKTLRDILVYLDVCDGNMEEGSLRCEPNLSLRPIGQKEFGTRVELKNINSFRFVQKAMEYELRRQEKVLREGGRVVQETRLWNTEKEMTVVMRGKEEAHDYRYFPEPDLVPLMIPKDLIEEVRKTLPELPDAKRERFVRDYGIPVYDAEVLTTSKDLARYFEVCVEAYPQPKTVSNWIMTELLRELKAGGRQIADCPIPPDRFAGLLKMIDNGTISGKIAKTVFEEMYRTGRSPDEIVKERGLVQISDAGAIEALVEEVLQAYPNERESYRQGKSQLLGFFVGQVMKRSQGKANPGKVNELLKSKLGGEKK